jgi:hypothetical protein
MADNATFVIVGNGDSSRAGDLKLSNKPRLRSPSINL